MSLRPCLAPRCPTLVPKGYCAEHQKAQPDKARCTAHQRGYTWHHWQPFRRHFLQSLVNAGIMPVCGEALPTGPANRESACRDTGLLTFSSADGSSLHLDHEPELQDWERSKPERVCDPDRIVLKCASCHAAKTGRQPRLKYGNP